MLHPEATAPVCHTHPASGDMALPTREERRAYLRSAGAAVEVWQRHAHVTAVEVLAVPEPDRSVLLGLFWREAITGGAAEITLAHTVEHVAANLALDAWARCADLPELHARAMGDAGGVFVVHHRGGLVTRSQLLRVEVERAWLRHVGSDEVVEIATANIERVDRTGELRPYPPPWVWNGPDAPIDPPARERRTPEPEPAPRPATSAEERAGIQAAADLMNRMLSWPAERVRRLAIAADALEVTS